MIARAPLTFAPPSSSSTRHSSNSVSCVLRRLSASTSPFDVACSTHILAASFCADPNLPAAATTLAAAASAGVFLNLLALISIAHAGLTWSAERIAVRSARNGTPGVNASAELATRKPIMISMLYGEQEGGVHKVPHEKAAGLQNWVPKLVRPAYSARLTVGWAVGSAADRLCGQVAF